MATKKKLEQFKFERAFAGFQLDRTSDFESGNFRGIASVFGSIVDTFPNRTRFRRGAFAKTIAAFKAVGDLTHDAAIFFGVADEYIMRHEVFNPIR